MLLLFILRVLATRQVGSMLLNVISSEVLLLFCFKRTPNVPATIIIFIHLTSKLFDAVTGYGFTSKVETVNNFH